VGRRRWQTKRELPGDPSDPHGLVAWALRYLEALKIQHRTPQALRQKRKVLSLFLGWCEERGLHRPTIITRPILLRYQRHLFLYRKKDGKPLGISTQISRLVVLRGFFRWLTRENVILSNPASELDLPKRRKKLPKDVLTPAEAELVLSLPDVHDPLGLRDRAMLEVLYATGIRRMEIAGLGLFDVEPDRCVIRIREGKGGRDRVLPLGERAMSWCQRYLDEVRPELLVPPDPGAFFLTCFGEGFSLTGLSQTIRKYVTQADLGKRGSCHLFRHSMATAMLENGADVRYVQEMLGHSQLSTTEIYTRVSVAKLREVHSATHPGLRPLAERQELDELDHQAVRQRSSEDLEEGSSRSGPTELAGRSQEAGEPAGDLPPTPGTPEAT